MKRRIKSINKVDANRNTLPIEFLVPNRNQPRKIFNDDSINELANSIREKGVLLLFPNFLLTYSLTLAFVEGPSPLKTTANLHYLSY